MPSKHRWIWELYFLIILFFAVQKTVDLLSPNSEEYLYYFILRSFNPIFHITYFAHLTHVLLNLIHCIPLLLYIYGIRFLNPYFWQGLFISRCLFEIFGHSYKLKTIAAYYQTNPKLLCIILLTLILPHIPSYVVCYRYALFCVAHKMVLSLNQFRTIQQTLGCCWFVDELNAD